MAQTSSSSGFTLTEATHFSRLAIKYGAIGIAVLIVGRIFLISLIAFYRAINPPPPPPPTVGFGILPQIDFPQDAVDVVPTSYSLETPTGGTPNLGDRAKVFLKIKSNPNLLADQRARAIAATYDFVFEPEIINTETYRWRKSQPLNTQLEMNVFTHDFELTSDYLSRPDLLNNNNLPDDFAAVERVKRFLDNANLLPDDVATAAGEIVYLKALGGELETAFSLSDADFIQVDLNRYPIDGVYRMYTSTGYDGTIHAIISGAFSNTNSVVEMVYKYQPVDYQTVETYPLRTTQQAWKLLQGGEGYVASFDGEGEAVIRRITVGYFEGDEEQDYLMPIYVFEGDDEFLGYISAVDPSYLQIQ